jgi:hypothetical protein
VATAGPAWNPPTWSDHGQKHFPRPNVPWKAIVEGTGTGKKIAKYHPNLTRASIEQLEMETVTGQWNEILPHPKPNTRMFWRELPDLGFPVGASGGRETTYVYVEYNSSGPVHGRPMTPEELRAKGATP